MPLHDMPKRLIPFPLVLVAIVGFFALGVLYFDLRGKETHQAVNAHVAVEQAPVPAAVEATPDTAPTLTVPASAPEALGLPSETPTSDVPAAAVFDCWRYEFRGDRLIVDRDYRHIAGEGIVPAVGPDTLHLRCKTPQYALRSDDGAITLYWSGGSERATYEPGRSASVETDTLYRIDPRTGEMKLIAHLDGLDPLTDYALVTFTPDASAVWLRADSSKKGVSTFFRISLGGTAEVRSYSYPQVTSPFEFLPDQTRAVGFEYTAGTDFPKGPVYPHRINLATGARVRTKPIASVFDRDIPEINWRPVFIDNERLIMPGKGPNGIASGAIAVNVFTGATAPVPQLSGTVELFALTQDGSTFYAFSDQMPLTAIPVSALPKP